jgi:hypothetical protein
MENDELPDIEYLRDLADRLMNVPGPHVDQYDCDHLLQIAEALPSHPKAA